jgi:predicted CXXCH cytochrome family protein
MLDGKLKAPTDAWAEDVHGQKGLTCAACHGGNPNTDDMVKAMSPAAGFVAKPLLAHIPQLCARCHSNGAFMRKYNPSLRTDQLAQYRTSVHGKRLAVGDTRVAVCTDCHSIHEIRPASDPLSTVHPLKVAETCARCHADVAHMKPYRIPTDQFAGYQASVHYAAMATRGDLSAPTCSTCHGTHGAAPPGVASVEFVCSTCHVFQAQLFDESPHKQAFAAMNLAPCTACHSNHRIVAPTDAMLGTGQGSVCLKCHAEGDAGYSKAGQMARSIAELEKAIADSEAILDRAERSGMEVSQPKLEQNAARENLIKARVNIHTFDPAKVAEMATAGKDVAAKTYQAGLAALRERDFRRKGLAISLITILVVLFGLRMKLRSIEARQAAEAEQEKKSSP